MYRLLKRNFNLAPSAASLTIVSVTLIVLCATPWAFRVFGNELLVGVPASFLAATLLLPLVCFLILWIATRTAEDVDRNDPRYENE